MKRTIGSFFASFSALGNTLSSGDFDRAKELIDGGAKVSDNPELLIRAIKSNCSEETKCKLVDLLTSNGADPNIMWMNTSPMEEAIVTGSVIVAKKLLEAGANVSEERELLAKVVKTPWSVATKIKMFSLLQAHGADAGAPTPEILLFMLEIGVGVDDRFDEGMTNMHFMCLAKYEHFFAYEDAARRSKFDRDIIECVKILLEFGADVDVVDDKGNVPFVLAVEAGKEEIMDLLLEHMEAALN